VGQAHPAAAPVARLRRRKCPARVGQKGLTPGSGGENESQLLRTGAALFVGTAAPSTQRVKDSMTLNCINLDGCAGGVAALGIAARTAAGTRRRLVPTMLVSLLCISAACDDTETGETSGSGAAVESLYAVPAERLSEDFSSSTSYVPLVESLDVDVIGLDKAREVVGRASVMTVGKWLFIAGTTEPRADRYEVQDDGSLVEAGSISFANYGVPEFFYIDYIGNVTISETKAYAFNRSDGSHIVWNPTTLEITGEIEAPEIPLDRGTLESAAIVRGNRLYRTFGFVDYTAWAFSTDVQYLAVYDTESDELIDLIEETRCAPAYSRPFVDESNDLYFSGWVWTAAEAVLNDAPKNCALRIRDGEETFDADWQLTYADDLTDGREGGILRYMGNGQALLDVLHHEEEDLDGDISSKELSESSSWRLWSVDLEKKTGAPVEGLDFKAAGYQDVRVGDRTFLMVPNDDYSETTGYEVVDGEASRVFRIPGSSYNIVQVR
jgi:hypothetical protein